MPGCLAPTFIFHHQRVTKHYVPTVYTSTYTKVVSPDMSVFHVPRPLSAELFFLSSFLSDFSLHFSIFHFPIDWLILFPPVKHLTEDPCCWTGTLQYSIYIEALAHHIKDHHVLFCCPSCCCCWCQKCRQKDHNIWRPFGSCSQLHCQRRCGEGTLTT